MWFRVDDSLPTHHRVIEAGNAAIGLWVRAGAWSMGQLTDGFIPSGVASMFGNAEEIAALVRVGLWLAVDGGYQFHRWAEDGSGAPRQPTKAEIEGKRKADRERKAAALDARRAAGGRAASARTPDGVPEDSARNPDGIRGSSDHPDPTRPNPLLASLEGGAPPVDNPGEDPEPPVRCPAHLGLARPPRCGACKDARLEHEAWEQRAPAPPPPYVPKPGGWDPAKHCEHGQLLGACEICEYESQRVGEVIHAQFGSA